MNFYRRPFVYITPLFALGIFLGDAYAMHDSLAWLVMAVLVVAIIRLFLRKPIDYLFPFGVVLGILFIGGVLVDYNRFDDMAIGNDDQGEYINSTMLLNVLEVNESESVWQRMVCESVAIVGEDAYVPHREKLLVYTNSSALSKNDQVLMRGTFTLIANKGNPGEFDSKHYWNSKNIYSIAYMDESQYLHIGSIEPSWFEKTRDSISHQLDEILDENLDESNLAVAKALILGDKSLLRPELKKSFSSAGAMHVLAVSGLHIGIILEILLFIFGRFSKILKKNRAVLLAIGILWIYAAVVGFSPSVVRATIMFSLIALGKIFSKQSNGLNILLFSACLLLSYNPLMLYDIGFQLSYLAMLGIFLLYKPIQSSIFIKNRWLNKVWQGTSVGVSAQVFTIPVTLHYFHQFPNYFILTNIGMMVFAGLVLSLGLVLFVTSWVKIVGKLIAALLSFALTAMIFFVEWVEHLSGSVAFGFTLPWYLIVAAYIILFIVVLAKSKMIVLKVALFAAMVLIIAIQAIRYENITRNEFVVFNSNQLLMMVKQGDNIICLHNATNGLTDGLDFLIDAYSKIHPGKVKFVRLSLGETSVMVSGGYMKVVKFDNGYHILLPSKDKSFFLRTSTRVVPFKDDYIVDMPYIQSKRTSYNLRNGCYRIPLK